jgi:hypothetical protein
MATKTSHTSIPSEPLLTPLSHFPKRTPLLPPSLGLSPSSTSPLSNPSVLQPPCLVLDLSQPLHPPPTSPTCSGSSESIPLPLSHPTASRQQTKPPKCLLFRSPLPEGEALKQARSWHRAQLLDLGKLWELRRQRRIAARLIPMARPPTAISDDVLDVENNSSIVTGTPPLFPIPLSTSPQHNLEFQHKEPFWPTAWHNLTSIVCRPQRWQLDSLIPLSKTTKIPLKYRQPTTTKGSSHVSLQKDSVSPRPKLPKGWVYTVEEVRCEVKTEVVPRPVPDTRRPANPPQAQGHRAARRPTSPTPPGFEHNRGPAFIPFHIQENGREIPAHYIWAHLDAPNPFVEGWLSLDSPTYHSEIHAAAIHDVDVPPPPITADILWLLHTDYMGHDHKDEALGELGDRLLMAEVNRYRRLERKRKGFQDSITRLEDQMFTTDVERHMCISRLEGARAMVHIQGEMQRNAQAFCLSPWSVERGRLP